MILGRESSLGGEGAIACVTDEVGRRVGLIFGTVDLMLVRSDESRFTPCVRCMQRPSEYVSDDEKTKILSDVCYVPQPNLCLLFLPFLLDILSFILDSHPIPILVFTTISSMMHRFDDNHLPFTKDISPSPNPLLGLRSPFQLHLNSRSSLRLNTFQNHSILSFLIHSLTPSLLHLLKPSLLHLHCFSSLYDNHTDGPLYLPYPIIG